MRYKIGSNGINISKLYIGIHSFSGYFCHRINKLNAKSSGISVLCKTLDRIA